MSLFSMTCELSRPKFWPTPHGMCVPNKRRAGPSGNELGRAVNRSISSAAASPARTFPSPEKVQALKASAAAYGRNSPELLARYDPDTSSWKTCQRSFLEDWETFSETWPRSGTMRNGIAYRLPPLVPLTGGTGSGLWRTPDASIVTGEAANAEDRKRQGHAIGLHDQVNTPSMWPTPTSRDWKDGSAQACSNVPANSLLGREIHRFPTPGGTRPNDTDQISGRLANQIGGSLNPTWVEWLMGFPLGWTDLKDWATPSSRKSRKSSAGQS
jgi:hypothetical protein